MHLTYMFNDDFVKNYNKRLLFGEIDKNHPLSYINEKLTQ